MILSNISTRGVGSSEWGVGEVGEVGGDEEDEKDVTSPTPPTPHSPFPISAVGLRTALKRLRSPHSKTPPQD